MHVGVDRPRERDHETAAAHVGHTRARFGGPIFPSTGREQLGEQPRAGRFGVS
jgi:hypothetical protein